MCERSEIDLDFDVLLPLLQSHIWFLEACADWGDEPLGEEFIIEEFCRMVRDELPRLLRVLNEQEVKRATEKPKQIPAAKRRP